VCAITLLRIVLERSMAILRLGAANHSTSAEALTQSPRWQARWIRIAHSSAQPNMSRHESPAVGAGDRILVKNDDIPSGRISQTAWQCKIESDGNTRVRNAATLDYIFQSVVPIIYNKEEGVCGLEWGV
jgi:hypothetical protein